MPRSIRTVKGDKNQVSGPLLQPGEEAPERGHIQVKAGHLRPIQSKDKLVLAKDRPGHESQWHFCACLGKVILHTQGSIRSKIQAQNKMKCPAGVQP